MMRHIKIVNCLARQGTDPGFRGHFRKVIAWERLYFDRHGPIQDLWKGENFRILIKKATLWITLPYLHVERSTAYAVTLK